MPRRETGMILRVDGYDSEGDGYVCEGRRVWFTK